MRFAFYNLTSTSRDSPMVFPGVSPLTDGGHIWCIDRGCQNRYTPTFCEGAWPTIHDHLALWNSHGLTATSITFMSSVALLPYPSAKNHILLRDFTLNVFTSSAQTTSSCKLVLLLCNPNAKHSWQHENAKHAQHVDSTLSYDASVSCYS